ncbi:hypothetical protein JCM11491_001002 [Sporobolomyces phaffii]
MSSSRYRDDRNDGGYPPRHGFPPRDYYPPSSSSHPYDSRPPHYANSSTYAPAPVDSGSRFAPAGGGRGYEDRGYPNYPQGGAGGSNYTGPSRPSTSSTATTRGKLSTDPRASLRSSYRDLSPPASASLPIRDDAQSPVVPAPATAKGSYERSSKYGGATSSPAVTTTNLPQSSPGMEPGELLPTPKTSAVDLPSASSSRNGGGIRGGDDRERHRAEPTWAGHPATYAPNVPPRSYPTTKSKSNSTKLDKRPRSPDARGSERAYDKKAKVSGSFARPYDSGESPSTASVGPITSSMSSSQRATLPANPTQRAPPTAYSSSSSAPTGPRALRPLLPGQLPSSSSNGLLPLSGGRVTVNVPPVPKPKPGFAPIKTTQVAGPPTTAPSGTPAIVPAQSKGDGIKKFFPADDEEEDERRRVKERKAKEEKDESDRLARELEERIQSQRAKEQTKSRYGGQKKDDRMDIDDDRFAPNSLRDNTRRDRRRSPSRSRSRSRSVASSRSRSRSRSRDRARSRSRSASRDRDRIGRGSATRDGRVVRNGGDIPPPRIRSYNDEDFDNGNPNRQPLPSRPGQYSNSSRGYPSGGPRRYNDSFATPTGPAHRTPASYERPSHPPFGGHRNGYNANLTSSNAVVPGVVERKWGVPAAQTPADSAVADAPSASDGRPAPKTPSQLSMPPAPASNGPSQSGWTRPSTGPRESRGVAHEVGTPPEAKLPLEPPSLPRPDAVRPVSPPTPSSEPIVAGPPAAIGSSGVDPTAITEPVAAAADTERSAPPTEFYERIVQVGEGTYGKVYKARNVETGELVALKRIRMEAEKDGFPVTAVREIKLLQNLRHPNVVDLTEMLVSKGHVYMVMEYMDHDLTGILHHPNVSFSPAHLKSLMKQFLEGLGFIHRRGVLHRDLKGSNILLSRSGELKIADFGLARFFARGRNNDYTNRVITQWYKPPELLFGATVYGEEVDMWSAGCIFLELFARRPVFQGQDEIHQLEVIFKVTGTPTLENWPGAHELPWYELVKPKMPLASQLRSVFSKWITPAGLDVAERLLSLDPAGRPTAAEALEMEYFVSEEPQPELPDFLSTLSGSWHEFESKRARRKAREDAA